MAVVPVVPANTQFLWLVCVPNAQLVRLEWSLISGSGFLNIFKNQLVVTSKDMNFYCKILQGIQFNSIAGLSSAGHAIVTRYWDIANLVHFVLEQKGNNHCVGCQH